MNPNRYVNAIFAGDSKAKAESAWQYDYGLYLRIQGLSLPAAVEVHFALQQTGGEAEPRIGLTQDGVTDVLIPESMLKNSDVTKDYKIFAWVYLSDKESGRTEYQIQIPVKSRPAPTISDTQEDQELFREAITAVNEAADRAEAAGTVAKSWAAGGTGTRDKEDIDNAKYYAKKAQDVAEEIPGTVEAGKKDIDQYVRSKEADLKGDTGNVYFAAFAIKRGRLKMYSDPAVDKVRFSRRGSRLSYRLQLK